MGLPLETADIRSAEFLTQQELVERHIWKGSTTHDEAVQYFLFELRKSAEFLNVFRQPGACISQQAVSVLGKQPMLQECRRSFRESQLPQKLNKSSVAEAFGLK
jgi:hypothetical protein